ncbi:MAG: hypothetical protein IKA88_01915 [Clostridia bacterium]|nr:hypothetical protein [Clostridia bacterium]
MEELEQNDNGIQPQEAPQGPEKSEKSAKPAKKRMTKRKRALVILLSVFIFISGVLGFLQIGAIYTGKNWEHWLPDYEKVDIAPILAKKEKTEEDYRTLYYQTGLTKLGIDDLLAENNTARILRIQNALFYDFDIVVDHFNIFTYSEYIDGVAPICALQDGDILVTSTTRVSWLRYGHAALVVDGEQRLIAEAMSPGTKSTLNSADNSFESLANYMVLRPKVDEALKTQIAEYAKTELMGVPYRFTIGLFSKKFRKNIKGTQCAHLVWYAYKKFGIDLDGNGGWLVKPRDMAISEHVEVVQAFGFDLDDLW